MKAHVDESCDESEPILRSQIQYRSCMQASKNLLVLEKGCVCPHGDRVFASLRKMRTQIESPCFKDQRQSDFGMCNPQQVSTTPSDQQHQVRARAQSRDMSTIAAHSGSPQTPAKRPEELGWDRFQELLLSVQAKYLQERLHDPSVKKLYLSYAGAYASYKYTRAYSEVEQRGEAIRARYYKDHHRFSGTFLHLIAVGQKTIIVGLEDVLVMISATPLEEYDEAVHLSHGAQTLGTVRRTD
jgi:hypothetical protein